MATSSDKLLGNYLKDRRARLDPSALGFGLSRRRTPGLRREEVAQRANVSATWYTWIEQGRGGSPSTEVLDRVADALMMTATEREHLFLLAQRRPPEIRCQPPRGVAPRLQRLIDALDVNPAFIKSASWDVVAWNRAAATVLTDYAALAPEQRNVLRLLFGAPADRAHLPSWESDARFAVAAFRLETARAGETERAQSLVDELSRTSPEFAAIWRLNEVGRFSGLKQVVHPAGGLLTLEGSAFPVDGEPDLGLVIYTPAAAADRELIRSLVEC